MAAIDELLDALGRRRFLFPTAASPRLPPTIRVPADIEFSVSEPTINPIDIDDLLRTEQPRPIKRIDEPGSLFEDRDDDDGLQRDLPDIIGTREPRDVPSDWPEPYLTDVDLLVLRGQGRRVVDVLAWYCPFHFYLDEYGIYIRTEALDILARRIAAFIPSPEARWVAANRRQTARLLRKAAFISLYLHEFYHHKTEAFATRLEIIENQARFVAYWRGVYEPARTPVLTDDLIEEGLACAEVLKRLQKTSDVFGKAKTYGDIGTTKVLDILRDFTLCELKIENSPGYRLGQKLLAKTAKEIDLNLFGADQYRLMSAVQAGFLPGWQQHEDWRFVPNSFRGLFDKRTIAYELVPAGKRARLPVGAAPAIQAAPKKALRIAKQFWGIRMSTNPGGRTRGDHCWLENEKGDRDHVDLGAGDMTHRNWEIIFGLINKQYGLSLKNNQESRRIFFEGPISSPSTIEA